MNEPSWREIVKDLDVRALPASGLWNVAFGYVSGPRKLKIEAKGTWGVTPDRPYGPDGDRFSSDAVEKCLCPIVPRGALIAKIGGGTSDRTGFIIAVGSLCTFDLADPAAPNITPVRGTLFLAMNDEPGKFREHTGNLLATIWEAS